MSNEDSKGCAVLVIVMVSIIFVLGTLSRLNDLEKKVKSLEYDCIRLEREVELLQKK